MRFVTFSEAAELIKSNHLLSASIEQSGVALKKQGKEWVGLCPFHDEKSPSFSVNDAKGVYYCRGCRAHGDVIRYHAEREGLSPGQIIKRMAELMDLSIRDHERTRSTPSAPVAQRPARATVDQLVDFHDSVAKIAHLHLVHILGDPDHPISRYLARRAIPTHVIREYGLGYLPTNRSLHHIITTVSSSNPEPLPLSDAQWNALSTESGLINGHYETSMFQGRLLFPVINAQGKCIAFSGRVVPDHDQGVVLRERKYVNSPETHIFQKSRTLFGLTPWHIVTESLEQSSAWRKRLSSSPVVAVEGVTDVMRLALSGEWAVAGLGTALSSDQLTLILRNSPSLTVLLDGDTAGQKAAEDILVSALNTLKSGQSIEARLLPPGDDPDTFFVNEDARRLIGSLPRVLPEQVWFARMIGERTLPLSLADRISIEALCADNARMPNDIAWRLGLFQLIHHKTGYAPIGLGGLQKHKVALSDVAAVQLDDPTRLWLIRVSRSPAILCALEPFADSWWAKEVVDGLLASQFEVPPAIRTLIYAFRAVREMDLNACTHWGDFAALLIDRGLPTTMVLAWNQLITDPDAQTDPLHAHTELFAPDLWEYELTDIVASIDSQLTRARDQALNRPSLSGVSTDTP